MKITLPICLLFLVLEGVTQSRYEVQSQAEFNTAHSTATAGDSIVWLPGTYSDVFMNIQKGGLTVTASVSGSVIFNGASKAEIHADLVTLSGVQYIGGNIGTDHVIRIWGSDVLVTQVNIQDYTCYKYLIVDEDSQRTTISYSNFENRLNLDDQNILSILVDALTPGYHKVQYCSFRNFEGTGNDLGIEPIRIGVSTQADFDSRSIVEYCYFTNCDGDGELISNKASQNVIRYNTFENNSKAELVLRHGDEAIVYGNFFLNNMGGVRVREGSGHYIFNNYFEGGEKRSIYLQNEASDPLTDIHVYFNTFVKAAEMILGGGSGSFPPTNVTIANNIFADPISQLFEEPTGSENWLGNIANGTLGITAPSGVSTVDPKLETSQAGYYQISSTSPAIDQAVAGYPAVPTFTALDYDAAIELDLMGQSRPSSITSKDVGAVEFSSALSVTPHATADNTGPDYLNKTFAVSIGTSPGGQLFVDPAEGSYPLGSSITVTAVADRGFQFNGWTGDLSGQENPLTFLVSKEVVVTADFIPTPLAVDPSKTIEAFPNPTQERLMIGVESLQKEDFLLQITSLDGRLIKKINEISPHVVKDTLILDIADLERGTYLLQLISKVDRAYFSTLKFIKN